jgi:hypothetical protein
MNESIELIKTKIREGVERKRIGESERRKRSEQNAINLSEIGATTRSGARREEAQTTTISGSCKWS